MRLVYFTDFSEQFPYRFLRGVYKYAQETGEHWTVCRMPSTLKGQYSFEEFVNWAKGWKADVVIGQFTPDVDYEAFRRNGIIFMPQDYISLFPGVPNITADYKKTGDIVLRHEDDAVAAEGLIVHVGGELADDYVGMPVFGPFHKGLEGILPLQFRGHAAHRPMLPSLLRILVDSPQKPVGKPFGKVGKID